MPTKEPSTTPTGEDQDPFEWVKQRLGSLPQKTSRLAAVRQLLEDLEVARRAGGMDEGAGWEAALLAAFRACHALGRPELTVPFRALVNGLRDLRRGVQPESLKPASVDHESGHGPGGLKPTEHWDLALRASVALGLLVELAKMPVEAAARAVAERLAAKGLSLGGREVPLWQAVVRRREDIRRGKCPEHVRERYFVYLRQQRETVTEARVRFGREPSADELRRGIVAGIDEFLDKLYPPHDPE